MKTLAIWNDPKLEKAIASSFAVGSWPQATLMSSTEGAKGIEMVSTESPDMVLLDLMLPDMDGFEVLSRIRALSDVPVIVVTAMGEEMERVRGLDLGADDYIVKPVSDDELVARVGAVLRRTIFADVAFHVPLDPRGLLAIITIERS